MHKSRRGFSLLELMVVLFIAALLAGLLVGQYHRYNAQNDLHRATERLMAELSNAKTQARSFATPQMRNSVAPPPAATSPASPQSPGNFLKARILQASPTQGLLTTTAWPVGEEQGAAVMLHLTTTNLPSLPYTTGNGTLDQGLTLELGESPSAGGELSSVLASIAFQPDGTILVVNSTLPVNITLGNGISNQTINLSPLGVAALTDGP